MRYAYLTCELVARDLDSRLLIAAHLVKRGIHCVLGHQWGIFGNAGQCPKGAILFKTANEVQGRAAHQAKSFGHRVVMSDEEILSLTTEQSVREITSEIAVKSADLFLAMDQRHREIVESVSPVPCEVVGNARVDLLMNYPEVYREDVERARKAGPYILFNTNFATLNSVWGSSEIAGRVMHGALNKSLGAEQSAGVIQETISFEQANLKIIKPLIVWARETFPQRVVVRPHPAENPDFWKSLANVEVIERTNPIPWLMGAEVMIHSSSTTGLEGALIGTPCLNIHTTPFGERFAARDVNHTVRTIGDAKAAMEAFLKHGDGPLAKRHELPFAPGGAEKTAAAIAQLAPNVDQLRAWGVHNSKPAQIAKFDISADVFRARTERVFNAAKVKAVNIAQLDRAMFLLAPA